jgi:hypothetical protein
MRLLSDQVKEELVDAGVIRQLGMEGRDEKPSLAEEHRVAVQRREHLDLRPCFGHPRRADEHPAQHRLALHELEIGFEARHLPSVCVSLDSEVDEIEVVAVEQDHSRTGSEDRAFETADGFLEAIERKQPTDGGRLSTRDDQPVEAPEFPGLADLDRISAETPQHGSVLAEVAL